jgi:hypothetical protein
MGAGMRNCDLVSDLEGTATTAARLVAGDFDVAGADGGANDLDEHFVSRGLAQPDRLKVKAAIAFAGDDGLCLECCMRVGTKEC